MDKGFLEETDDKFYRQISSFNKPYKRFERYKTYWSWLSKVDEFEKLADSDTYNIDVIKANLIFNLVKWLINTDTKVKDFTSNWNPKLVKRTGIFIEKWKGDEDVSNEEQASLFDRILKEHDFATMAYCCQMLQRDKVINFGDLYKVKPKAKKEEPSIEPQGIKRPAISKPYILDTGMKYYHPDAKELMTYDECVERGLGVHLLMYPKGHPMQNIYVGFLETNSDKIQTEFDEKTEEFLETVFIDGEKLFKDDQ